MLPRALMYLSQLKTGESLEGLKWERGWSRGDKTDLQELFL
jgi:hypothetical protein